MVVVDRAYSGAAASTIINTAMTATVPGVGGTISVADDSGYPSSGKFEIVVDRAQPNEENILISSRSGTTFTIGQRGYDGSVASAHTSGEATCEADLSGRTVQLFVDHVDDVETDPHSTKLLNNTRHDVEARHTFGAALGTPVTPTALTPDIAGSAGSGNNPAREDHVHNVPAAAAGNITGAAGEGAAASFARSDHDHGIANSTILPAMFGASVFGTGTTTIDPDDATSHGASTSVSRTDHQHQATCATASTLTGANAEGSASTLARSDHNHAFTAADNAVVDTAQTTSSATYGDLATVGPTVTLTVPASGKVLVVMSSLIDITDVNSVGVMALEMSSANTLAADDEFSFSARGTVAIRCGISFLFEGLTPGSTQFRAKYRRTPAGTATFTHRKLGVIPILS
jgi:hypothetical protein